MTKEQLSSKGTLSYGATDDVQQKQYDNLGFDPQGDNSENNKSSSKTKYDEGKYYFILMHLWQTMWKSNFKQFIRECNAKVILS